MLLQPPCHYFLQNPPSAASPQLPGWGMDRQWRMVLRGFLNLWFGYQDSRGYIALIKLPLRNLKQNITGVCTGGGEKCSGRVGGWVGCTWPSPEDQSPERQVVESKQRSDMKNQRKWEKWRGEGGGGQASTPRAVLMLDLAEVWLCHIPWIPGNTDLSILTKEKWPLNLR